MKRSKEDFAVRAARLISRSKVVAVAREQRNSELWVKLRFMDNWDEVLGHDAKLIALIGRNSKANIRVEIPDNLSPKNARWLLLATWLFCEAVRELGENAK